MSNKMYVRLIIILDQNNKYSIGLRISGEFKSEENNLGVINHRICEFSRVPTISLNLLVERLTMT